MNTNQNENPKVVTAIPISVTGRYDDINITQSNLEVTNSMKLCYAYRKTVMFLALIDIFFSFIYAFNNFWYFFPLLLCFIGYYGAKNYNLNYTLSYIIYNIINLISRLMMFFYILSIDLEDENNYISFYIFSVICFLIELWILKVIIKFYNLLKDLTIENIQTLRNSLFNSNRIIYL